MLLSITDLSCGGTYLPVAGFSAPRRVSKPFVGWHLQLDSKTTENYVMFSKEGTFPRAYKVLTVLFNFGFHAVCIDASAEVKDKFLGK